MWRTPVRFLFFATFGCLAGIPVSGQIAIPTIDFDRQIRPIFSDRCFACHGPDEKQRMANLRLDLKTGGAFDDRGGHHLITPGDAPGSVLLERISSDRAGFRMPPASAGSPLTAEQVDLIRKWINQG